MDEARLAAIRARIEYASPAPWGVVGDHRIYTVGPDGQPARGQRIGMWPHVATANRTDDAAFAAHAREDVPALLGAYATSRILLARCEAALARIGDPADAALLADVRAALGRTG